MSLIRRNALIIYDALLNHNCSRKVEHLARVYNYVRVAHT